MRPHAVLLVALSAATACSSISGPTLSDATTTTVGPPAGVTEITVAPTTSVVTAELLVPAPYASAADLAADLSDIELAIRGDLTTIDIAEVAHRQQRAYRQLSYTAAWQPEVLAAVDPSIRPAVELQLDARLQFLGMQTGFTDRMPDWTIVEPEPAADLLAHYEKAEAATGIEWEYLAAINLVETGMGRINGVSSANAQGPMQFLPTTWAEAGIGEGDINDPHDAIQAAARYLVRRGGPENMERALWGYNNHDNYVAAVMNYAEIMRGHPQTYHAFHAWEIYFLTAQGDIRLPVGYSRTDRLPVTTWLTAEPGHHTPTDGSLDHALGGRRPADALVAPAGCTAIGVECRRIGVYNPLVIFPQESDLSLVVGAETLNVPAGELIESDNSAGELLQVGYHELAPGIAVEVVPPAGNPFAAEEMTLRSFAGLRPGMSLAEVESVLGEALSIDDQSTPGCAIWADPLDPYAPLLYFLWEPTAGVADAELARVQTFDRSVSTPSGLRVGSLGSDVEQTYGERIETVQPDLLGASSVLAVFVPQSAEDAAFRLVFQIEAGEVTSMWTATTDAHLLEEGCL